MPRTCTVCSHANRNEIETALSNGTALRDIAARHAVTSSSLFRHKNHSKATPLELVSPDDQNGTRQAEHLTGKRAVFVTCYVGEARGNGTQAARLAGYEGDDNTLAVTASQLLRNHKVMDAIALRLKPLQITADEVVREISEIAKAPWGEFITVKTKKNGEVDVRMQLSDKLKALELAGKYRGILADVIVRDRLIVFARDVYYRITDQLQLPDEQAREFLLPILQLEPDQLERVS